MLDDPRPAEVRYNVILMASTLGSRLASITKRSTEVANDSYGWCRRIDPVSRMI